MKKLLLVGALAASFVSAATVSFNCTPELLNQATNSGGSDPQSGNVSCAGFTGGSAIPVGATINSITMQYIVQSTVDGFGSFPTSTTYSIDAPGTGNDIVAAVLNIPNALTNGTGTLTAGGVTSGFAPYLAAFVVPISADGAPSGPGSATVTGTTFNLRFTADYTPSNVIPEPSTLALLGSALVGLGVMSRRKK